MIADLTSGLVVSCQAEPGSPLDSPSTLAALAASTVAGGAVGIRASGFDNIAAIKQAVPVPVIGLVKRRGHDVYITPTIEDALRIADAGADLVAVDATLRLRPDGTDMGTFIRKLAAVLPVPIVADVDEVAAAQVAADAGARFVATTMAGYSGATRPTEPDIALVSAVRSAVDLPVIAEGRYRSASQITQAFEAGAYAVVIGEAITDPGAITRRFISETLEKESR
jgi:N-acylglucosamine-6-phosphate 2-epimerase